MTEPTLAELEAKLEQLQALREPLNRQIAETCREINAIETASKARALQLGISANWRIVIDFNCTVGPNVLPDDHLDLFGAPCRACEGRGEVGGFVNAESGYQNDPCPFCDRGIVPEKQIHHFDKADIFDILVAAGCFDSKSQARKNWRGVQVLPTGYSEFGPVGKRKIHLFVWNPST